MNERDFSIRTRRTTRVAIRIPVQINFRSENGNEEVVGAWTLIVNRHGARCEATRPLEPNIEVLVKNAANGRSATAVVVWGNNQPDGTGKFEFAVALRELCNLWQIHFPTQDEPQELSHWECRSRVPGPLHLDEASTATESAPAANLVSAEILDQFNPGSDVTTGPPHPPDYVSIPHVEAEEVMNTQENLLTPESACATTQSTAPDQRLKDAINDVIASALRSRIESESDRAVQERIGEIMERSRAIADEELQRIAVAGEQHRRSVQQEAEEVVSVSLTELTQRIVQQMPPIEEEIVHRCRHEAEQAASAAVESARDTLSREFDSLASTLANRESALLREVTELEQRVSQQIEVTAHQLEAQLAETAKDVFGKHASDLVQGINATHGNLLFEAEAKLAATSEELISEIRNGFARMLAELAQSFGNCQAEAPGKYSADRAENFNASPDQAWEHSGRLQDGSALQRLVAL
ncbi:MAG: hypothetical protein HYX72_00615 [Acidobacteria bacterium]|nr:hypothetical protein [Acidobacteriota bacterium]